VVGEVTEIVDGVPVVSEVTQDLPLGGGPSGVEKRQVPPLLQAQVAYRFLSENFQLLAS
jgi:hypothetical protein